MAAAVTAAAPGSTTVRTDVLPATETEYVYPPSQSILCPVCQEVCREPLITSVCHHSFCTACIFQALEREAACPMCRHVLTVADMHPNLALAGIIQELQVYCRYRPYGCALTMRLDSKESHEKACSYAPARCPNFIHGCSFEAVRQQRGIVDQGGELLVRQHLKDCTLEKMKGYIERNERQIAMMTAQLQTQAREIEELRLSLRRLHAASIALPNGTADGGAADPLDVVGSRMHNFPLGDLKCVATLAEHSCGVTSLAYDSGTLYSGGHDGTTKVWDLASTTVKRTLVGHQFTVWSLVTHPDSNRLFSASADNTIKIWDTASTATKCTASINGHKGRIYSLAVHGNRLFSASSDRTIKVWNLDSMELMATLAGHNDGVNSIVILDDGTRVVSGSHDQTIRVWDLATASCSRVVTSSPSAVLNLCSGDGYLFAAGYNADITVYDPRTFIPHATLSGHKWEVWQQVYTDGVLFTGSFDHTIKRWDMRTLACTATLRGHKGYVHAMTTDRSSIISGCADRTIKIWG